MLYPHAWLLHARTRLAVRGYPLYDVPHKGAERYLSEQQVEENFAYFMRVREERLALFQRWLCRKFWVNAPLNGDGIMALDRWMRCFGGGLLPSSAISDGSLAYSTLRTYSPPWAGKYAGFNVITDICIFIGEYLISKRPQVHWEIDRLGGDTPIYADNWDEEDEEGLASGEDWENEEAPQISKEDCLDYGKPALGGFPSPFSEDLLDRALASIRESHNASQIGYSGEGQHLITRCKFLLWYANASPDDPVGDYSKEEL